MNRIVATLIVALSLALPAPRALAASSGNNQTTATERIELRLDEPAFWNGGFIKDSRPLGPLAVSLFLPTDPVDYCPLYERCFDYKLDVEDQAARLRVALDVRGPDFGPPTGEDTDSFYIQAYDPDGTYYKSSGATYNQEFFVSDPTPGIWKMRVTPLHVTKASFVMRAKLDSEIPHGPEGALLPNLRSIPAADFSTTAAVGYYCGLAQNTCMKAEAEGKSLMSCLAEEQVLEGASECLRFSVGSENTGAGALDLRIAPLTDDPHSAKVTQVIHHSNETTETRDAGTVSYHPTHGHYHLSAYAEISLFEMVRKRAKGLSEIGQGRKNGFCLQDERIADWEGFGNEPRPAFEDEEGTPLPDCLSPLQGRMLQSSGWGDVYEYDRSGNYVPFTVKDGDYVLRSTVDAADVILESDEKDNVSYAWIRVEDGEVTVREHGYGTDPWDPHKVVSER